MKLAFKEVASPARTTHGGWNQASAITTEQPVSFRSSGKSIRTGAPLAWASATSGFFLVLLLTSLGLFALLQNKWGVDFQIYRYARIILIGSIWVFLIHDAFQQSILYGAMALFPPFLIVYGALYTESSFLKGAFLAAMIWLGLEVLFMEPRSFYASVQIFMGHVIDGGNRWINKTSRG